VRVSFALHGDDLDPAAVTALLGIEPTRSHARGDARRGWRTWKRGAWELALPKDESGEVEPAVRRLIAQLAPAEEALSALVAAGDVEATLALTVTCFATRPQAVSLPPDVVAWAGAIGAAVDVGTRWRPTRLVEAAGG
jgi:Domain of unknown function (DUF4279)